MTRQQELQKALELERQSDLADSQEYGQYKAVLDDYNNKVALRNTDIANKNRELRYNRLAQAVQMKNANIAEKSKFFDQAAYATQDWITKQLAIRNKLRAANSTQIERKKIMDDYMSAVASAQKEKDATKASSLISAAKWKAQNDIEQLQLKEAGYDLAFPYMAKGGGTISKKSSEKNAKVTYSRDPYPDLLLQNSKSTDKYVQKLSDHTIKLILQAKPLYVSK